MLVELSVVHHCVHYTFSMLYDIRGLKPLRGPSRSCGYRINQPFIIHTCSSLSYSPLMFSGILYSAIWLQSRVGVLFRVHFHLAVCILLLWLKEAFKSGSSTQRAANASFPLPSVMPPSARITSIPITRSMLPLGRCLGCSCSCCNRFCVFQNASDPS